MVTVIESSSALRKKKILKRSLNFTIMVIGQSGTGRSTFINTLCDQMIVQPSSTINLYSPEDVSLSDRELQLRKSSVELEDNEGVKISLNLIDTPGFGDSIDNSNSFTVIKDYIKYQFDEILVEESRLRRNPRFKDGRIHACLYFIVPTGHGLREIDVEIIKNLGEYVNVIPCISKADSLTTEELRLNKKLIVEDIIHYQLPIFDFNNEYFTYDDTMDDETAELNKYLQKMIPFAIMGSNTTLKDPTTGEVKRIRKHPWGVVDVFNNEISDVLTLKNTLLITHLNELKDFTHEVLYENYRTKTLGQGSGKYDDITSSSSKIVESSNKIFEKPVSSSNSMTSSTSRLNDREVSQSTVRETEYVTSEVVVKESSGVDDFYLKEEQIRKEEERLRAFEERVQNDLMLKREEIEARERELAELERRLAQHNLA
ncbi:hypothetical protein CANINC_001671 [Pichia inconspicua]|uniref:Septin-type G domain-containing protein n=1 Tax=Pichia inconspicua TaxID=52247 RepID=A0A4T0X3H7_9ASCO|nr:hypothetical protein CANINC_001671 [[Candida] inconspicua]